MTRVLRLHGPQVVLPVLALVFHSRLTVLLVRRVGVKLHRRGLVRWHSRLLRIIRTLNGIQRSNRTRVQIAIPARNPSLNAQPQLVVAESVSALLI